jgi:hypothetical protein
VGDGIDVAEYRRYSHPNEDVRRRHERKGRHDDQAGHTRSAECETEAESAVRDSNRMANAKAFCERSFELGDVDVVCQIPPIEHVIQSREQSITSSDIWAADMNHGCKRWCASEYGEVLNA